MTAPDLRRWAATLRGEVLLPGDPAFDDARRVWNLEIDRRPAAIVRCAGESDVVGTLDFAYQRSLAIAIRSGGHSQAGHSTCDGGLLIDLGAMRAVRVDGASRVAHAAAGARVADLLAATGPAGFVTPTGGCPDVGLGGLTLGGGESFLMAAFGAVCDNVLSARVVTADGRILVASADEHSDLFWALRGGGGNFGVVTAFDYQLHPLAEVLSGRFEFPVSAARDVLRRYRDLMPGAPDALQTSGGVLSSGDGEPMLFIALCYCGDRPSGDRVVEQWRTRLQPDGNTMQWTDYTADLLLPPAGSAGDGAFLSEMNDEIVDVLAHHFARVPAWSTAAWNDFHGAVTRVARDATAFPLRSHGYDLFIQAIWKAPADRAAAIAWLDDFRAALQPWKRGLYVNNIGEESAAQTREAYGANYERLRAVKAAYDPDNVFRRNHNITPA